MGLRFTKKQRDKQMLLILYELEKTIDPHNNQTFRKDGMIFFLGLSN